MKTIDLRNYVTTGKKPNEWGYGGQACIALKGYKTGQKIAKDFDIKNMEGEKITLDVPYELGYIESRFLSGMFRTLIKRQGIDATKELVEAPYSVQEWLDKFWQEERVKESKKAAKKEREASLGQWTQPIQFLIPDIGTRIRLKEDWTFLLYSEGRNGDIMNVIGAKYAWETRDGIESHSVAFKAGTILKVDRIYIRKGVKDYSSITFNVEKGHNSVLCHATGEHVFQKKGGRFWAKLSDVNKMTVEVDTATLSEN